MNMNFTWSCWIRIDVDVSTELFKVKTAFIGILGKLQFCISLFSERINGVNEKTFVWRSIGLDQLKKLLSGKSKKGAFENINQISHPAKVALAEMLLSLLQHELFGAQDRIRTDTGKYKTKGEGTYFLHQLLSMNGSKGGARSCLGPLMIYMAYMPIISDTDFSCGLAWDPRSPKNESALGEVSRSALSNTCRKHSHGWGDETKGERKETIVVWT